MPHDFYKILEVRSDASQEQIKRAYRLLARQYHPDSTNPGIKIDKSFHDIQQAYETLSDPTQRKAYDDGNGGTRKEKVSAYEKNQNDANRNGSDRAWNILRDQSKQNGSSFSQNRSSSKASEDPSAKFEGSSIFRKPSSEPSRDAQSSSRSSSTFIGKLFSRSEEDDETKKSSKGDSTTKILNELRGEKTFRFTIDAMESLTGTSREVALEEENGPRVIRIKIPAGVSSDTSLRVNAPATDVHPPRRIRVKIYIESHELVEREGLNLIVKLPVTIGEAINGSELRVPTLEGPVKVRIPAGWSDGKRLRVKGRGVVDPESKQKGDLYIKTHIVLPEGIGENEKAKDAAKQLDTLYNSKVRSTIPEKLGEKK